MLARLQRVISVTLLLFVALWAAVGLQLGGVPWAAGSLLLVPLGYMVVLGLEFLCLRASYRRGDPMTPSAGELCRAWFSEALWAPRVFLWRQPFRSESEGDSVGESVAGRRGIVLIHGFFCNRGIWNSWMARLRERSIPFVAVSLEPIFAPIDAYRVTVDAAVVALRRDTGLPPIIVAHSMGGLAARHWLSTPGALSQVHRVVTIATPHRGTWLARFGHTANGVQMREGGEWLARLAANEDHALAQRFICFWSHCDNIVFPTANATLPGADNRHLRATPHVHMVDHPEVFATVEELALSSTSTPRLT